MAELFFQLDLFAHAARQPEPVCTGCGRTEAEAPAYVINDRGRFCLDCEALAFSWTPTGELEVGATTRLISSSRGAGHYFAGGPDHTRPWRNPALDDRGGRQG